MWGFAVEQSTSDTLDANTELSTVDSIWLNTGDEQLYTRYDFGNYIKVEYITESDMITVEFDHYRTIEPEQKFTAYLSNDNYIGAINYPASFYSSKTLDDENVTLKLKNKNVAVDDK
ncbi:hypothetical protein AB6C63_023825 (plasmid) [Vibrio cyclitrophicus]